MAAVSSGRSEMMDPQNESQIGVVDRLKRLYPAVNEEKTPLPRSWSPKEKYSYIGLSQSNLRVHYKGHGKTHRDAASVQATHPIPAACGLYYFEVKIVSKGRDGYMGIGLSAQGVNMNRLPGWDKQSYGYHGDDGNSFCSSGTGQTYGPTFTTGDVIGCGVNLIDNTCFYTKNGHHLGTAFRDLPPNLYPTVGLQTPGEVVDANFGQEPFVFDIEDMMKELRFRTRTEILDFPVPESQGEWQAILNKMVSTYLVHHGYYNTAEAFAHITDQPFNEDVMSIKNRQKILKLVLAGRMGAAIDKTCRLYPGLLENNQNLLFMLKCRQFVEMVNGSDLEEVCHKKSIGGYSPSYTTSPRPNSPIQTSVIQSTKSFSKISADSNKGKQNVEEMNQNNTQHNGNSNEVPPIIQQPEDSDIEMETQDDVHNGHGDSCNGKNSNGYQNGNSHNPTELPQEISICDNEDEDMDVDVVPVSRKNYAKPAVERILEFGRELYSMSQRLNVDKISSEHNQKMLEDAFSLLAYSNPWSSPVGWQLNPSQRENVCASLNSAILESNNKPRRPPLEIAMAHAQELIHLMSTSGLGSCAFASVVDLLDQ
ncbi:ran-binding protein 9 isoform X2 [Aethina tumida]|uniref:ran-binding protein 9 isoform X2 n=1 Tax=Aethina tumida TaxID=116153 RepID=UPI0021497D27|nr:ran-binding protein 9 isoform X2 [Aethina tumida]